MHSDTDARPEAGLLAQLADVRAGLAALEKQVIRAGREQLKANTLAAAQNEQFAAALEQFRAAEARREAEISALQERNRTEQVEARLAVVRAILPAIDGIDEALRSGQATLTRQSETALLRKLLDIPTEPAVTDLRITLGAWLQGLNFVRSRLLNVLAAEGVTPIGSVGTPFNPQLHLALEAVDASNTPPGTIVQEIRRGYRVGERMLRHAEVIVAREQ